MKTVDEMIDDILKHEGGYVDHKSDKGGATNHGISLRYAKGIGLDLDGDGDTDKDDIRLVTPEVARKLYKEDFLYTPRIDILPDYLEPQMFDMAVNHGPPRAITMLQRSLNMLRSIAGVELAPLEDDGVMGKRTRLMAEAVTEKLGKSVVNNKLVDMRVSFFEAIVRRDPSQKAFIKGWLRRAESFRM